MGAQRGGDILLKIETPQGFVAVAGLRTKRLALDARTVDVTDSESAGRWRELLAGAGIRTASLSGTGIFKDAASDVLVRDAFFGGTAERWRAVLPDFGSLTGPMLVSKLEYAGSFDGELTFEIALESAGEVVFEAET